MNSNFVMIEYDVFVYKHSVWSQLTVTAIAIVYYRLVVRRVNQ